MTDAVAALRARVDWFRVVAGLLALVTSALFLAPLARVVVALFGGGLEAAGGLGVLTEAGTWQVVGNTVVIVGVSGVLAVVIGALLAYANERTDARIPAVTDLMPLMPFLVPPLAGSVGWIILLSPGAGLLNHALRAAAGSVGLDLGGEGPFTIFSWTGLIFVYTLYQVPYVYLMMAAGLRNLDASLEEQARVCGARYARTLWKVTFPAVRQSLGSAFLLLVWLGFALYSVPAVLSPQAGIDVLSVEIVGQVRGQYPPRTQSAVALSLIVMAAVGGAWVFQRRLQRHGVGATLGGKGRATSRVELGVWKHVVRVLITGYMILVAVLPLAALALVTLQGYWNPVIDWSGLSLDTLQRVVFDDLATRESIVNSLTIAVVGASAGMVIASVLSLWIRDAGPKGRLVDAAIKLPPAVSAIVIALGVLLLFGGPPLSLGGSLTILFLAFMCLYLPQGSISADGAASQVGDDLREAAIVGGARGWRVFSRISVPLMIPGLVAGWALLFVRMLGDVTASAILGGPRNPVVGLRILEIFEAGRYAELAGLSIMLAAVNALVLGIVLGVSRRRSSFSLTS